MFRFAIFLLAFIPACQGDETLSAYGAADKVWVLESVDGAAWSARTTITFPEEGKFAGNAPCNAYFGAQRAPYPWFEAGPIGATRRACPELDQEAKYFKALEAMTLAEVSGDVLVLSNEDGREMVFRAD